MFFVYALVDPGTDEVRYIGKSSTGMDRPRSHFEPNRVASDPNLHKRRWIARVQAAGAQPIVRVLEHGDCDEAVKRMEVAWIARGRAEGWPLTNLTGGGDGAAGYSPSAETRALMSAAHMGRKRSPETRAKIAAAKRGKPRLDLAERNRQAAGKPGRPHTEEERAKIAASLVGNQRRTGRTGWKPSEETLRRMSEGQRRRWAERNAKKIDP